MQMARNTVLGTGKSLEGSPYRILVSCVEPLLERLLFLPRNQSLEFGAELSESDAISFSSGPAERSGGGKTFVERSDLKIEPVLRAGGDHLVRYIVTLNPVETVGE